MSHVQVEVLDAAACGLLFLAGVALETLVEPRHRVFRLDDASIALPYVANETVPTWLLLVLSLGLPAAAIFAVAQARPRQRAAARLALRGLFLGFAANVFVVGLLKHMLGNQRPDFLVRCEPAAGTPLDQYVDVSVCTSPDRRRLAEGFRSTPSGHSAHSFCGLLFLALFVGGQFGTLRAGAPAAELLATLSPLVLALFIAASRIADYKHHWYDVLLGSAIGVGSAWTAYRWYFPAAVTPADDDSSPV